MSAPASHADRVYAELTAAGMTKYGHLKLASRYLHLLIHENEHIMGVVYGRYEGGTALLAATDQRILFLDKKPLFVSNDELAYDVVSGVKYADTGILGSVSLFTKLGSYHLRYVNIKAAEKFIKYIEKRSVEVARGSIAIPETKPTHTVQLEPAATAVPKPKPTASLDLEPAATTFLRSHHIAVLSTQDRTGNLAGAAVIYTAIEDGAIYILTRTNTAKARNILAHQQVALTIFDEAAATTLQLAGIAEVESADPRKTEKLTQLIEQHMALQNGAASPVMQLSDGAFEVLRITVVSAAFHTYQPAAM